MFRGGENVRFQLRVFRVRKRTDGSRSRETNRWLSFGQESHLRRVSDVRFRTVNRRRKPFVSLTDRRFRLTQVPPETPDIVTKPRRKFLPLSFSFREIYFRGCSNLMPSISSPFKRRNRRKRRFTPTLCLSRLC